MKKRWYFDTWSPLDGLAFASQRASDEGERTRTVALEPPYWRGRAVTPATAMRAERGPFQVGFFDDKGRPISFATLEELVDVVRQAYLGGGFGPPPDVDMPPLPAPDDGNADKSMGEILDTLPRRKTLITAFGHDPSLDEAFDRSGAAVAHVVGFLSRRAGGSVLDDALVWEVLLARLDLRPAPLTDHGWYWPGLLLLPPRVCVDAISSGLLFRTPHPYRRNSTLGDQLMSAFATRDYLDGLVDRVEMSMLVFVAAVVIGAGGSSFVGTGGAGRARLLDLALDWLAREAARVPAASDAGRALHDFAAKRIP